jgi:pimeloyl-ACP methyl ester carboxylesterase
VPLADTEAFQHDCPRARTVVLEGCGHLPMLERPQAFNTHLVKFIEALT